MSVPTGRKAVIKRYVLHGICDLIQGQINQGWATEWANGATPTDDELDLATAYAIAEMRRIERRIKS